MNAMQRKNVNTNSKGITYHIVKQLWKGCSNISYVYYTEVIILSQKYFIFRTFSLQPP